MIIGSIDIPMNGEASVTHHPLIVPIPQGAQHLFWNLNGSNLMQYMDDWHGKDLCEIQEEINVVIRELERNKSKIVRGNLFGEQQNKELYESVRNTFLELLGNCTIHPLLSLEITFFEKVEA
jgi:hypothetical protein